MSAKVYFKTKYCRAQDGANPACMRIGCLLTAVKFFEFKSFLTVQARTRFGWIVLLPPLPTRNTAAGQGIPWQGIAGSKEEGKDE